MNGKRKMLHYREENKIKHTKQYKAQLPKWCHRWFQVLIAQLVFSVNWKCKLTTLWSLYTRRNKVIKKQLPFLVNSNGEELINRKKNQESSSKKSNCHKKAQRLQLYLKTRKKNNAAHYSNNKNEKKRKGRTATAKTQTPTWIYNT